jgi:hypothetical protein
MVLALTGAPSLAAPLDELMTLLAARRHGEADFEQTQYLAALSRPLHSSGILSYDAPDRLEQRTLKPRPQSLLLEHGVLTMTRGTHQRSLQLQDAPQLAPLVDCMRATLAGDRAALEQNFELTLEGGLDHWQLQLLPRTPALTTNVRDIRIAGRRDAIVEVEVHQADGDHSLMSIQPRE